MPALRLLVVVYDYPPSTSVGGTRWFTMKKYLERLGYGVTILTTDAYGRLPSDEGEDVIRAADLVSSTTLRRALGRPALSNPEQQVEVDTAPPALLTKVVVPDIYAVSWVPSAIRTMRRLVRERRIDVLVSTSPKDSTHLAGLARPKGLAWVADFRDGWIFESTRPPLPTRAQRKLDSRLEALVVHRADAVVAFSDVLAEDFKQRLGRDACYVPNGWDPDLALVQERASSELHLERPRHPNVRLVYTGSLTGAEGAPTDRTPIRLLEAMDVLAQEEHDVAKRLELIIVGRLTTRDQAILARFEHLALIRHLGYVPRPSALAIQRSADALVLVSGTTPSSIPHKLFEYLGARKPILHLGHQGAAARILEETGAGVTISPDDCRALVEQLKRIALSQFARPFTPRGIDRYSYPYVAKRMADVIERAVSKRTSPRS